MSVGIGVRVGSTVSSVAVLHPGGPPVPVERSSVLHLGEDGAASLGVDPDDGYRAGAHARTGSTFVDFLDHVGDTAGVRSDDGALSRGEDLVATAIECLLAEVPDAVRDPDAHIVASHPTHWDDRTVAALRNALDYVGQRSILLVADAEAAAAWFASQVSHRDGGRLAVFHLDSQGSTVSLVHDGIAGEPFRYTGDRAPSVPRQLAAALTTFGWTAADLDATVITTEDHIDVSAAHIVAQSIRTALGVRTVVSPHPEHTAVVGAAELAATGARELFVDPAAPIRTASARRTELERDMGDGSPGGWDAAVGDAATAPLARVTTPPPTTPREPEPAGGGVNRRRLLVVLAILALVVAGGAALAFAFRADGTTDTATSESTTPAAATTTARRTSLVPPQTLPPTTATTTDAVETVATTTAESTTDAAPVTTSRPRVTLYTPTRTTTTVAPTTATSTSTTTEDSSSEAPDPTSREVTATRTTAR